MFTSVYATQPLGWERRAQESPLNFTPPMEWRLIAKEIAE